jgi:hypothetical protein
MRWQKFSLLIALIIGGGFIMLAARNAAQAEATITTAASVAWPPGAHVSTTANFGAFTAQLRTAPNGDMLLIYNQRLFSSPQQPETNPYYRVMASGSNQWSAPQPVYVSGVSLGQVSFAFNGNSVAHAVWRTTTEIHHASQNLWPDSYNLVAIGGASVVDPAIAIGPDNVVHVVWSQGNPDPTKGNDIYHAYSLNNGVSWSAATALAGDTHNSQVPTIAITANGDAHVIWEETLSTNNHQLRYKRGAKSGSTYIWDATYFVVSDSLTTARQPLLLAEGNVLHFSFTRRVSNNEQYAYYRQRASNGSWGTMSDITQGVALSVNTNAPFYLLSDMVICNNNLTIFYHGNPTIGSPEQIFTHELTDSGWSSRQTVTTDNERRVRPSAACRNGVIHLTYEQVVQTYQNHQIYHAFAHDTIFLPIIRR